MANKLKKQSKFFELKKKSQFWLDSSLRYKFEFFFHNETNIFQFTKFTCKAKMAAKSLLAVINACNLQLVRY